MEYYDKYQIEQIDENTLTKILSYSKKENKIYNEKISEQYLITQKLKISNPKKYRTNVLYKIGYIAKDIAIQRNIYKLETELEKDLLMLNIMFPNDLDFLQVLKLYDPNKLIYELLERLYQIDKKYERQKSLVIKKLLINKYITHNKEQIISILSNYKIYSDEISLTMLYTRLLQIKIYNIELYNKIFEAEKTKTLLKK